MTPLVIDLSHHNAIPGNYAALVSVFQGLKVQGIAGIIHKASESTGMVDDHYAIRRKAAFDAGLLWGAYHFLHSGSIAAQAAHFLATAVPDNSTLMAVDHESTATLSELRQFIEVVEASLGRPLVIYSGNTIKDQLGPALLDTFFGSRRLWLAQYGPKAVVQKSWPSYWLWQYSEAGSLPGITGSVDLNAFDRGPDVLRAEWAGASAPVSSPVPPPVLPPAPTIHPADSAPAPVPAPVATGFWPSVAAFFRSLFASLTSR